MHGWNLEVAEVTIAPVAAGDEPEPARKPRDHAPVHAPGDVAARPLVPVGGRAERMLGQRRGAGDQGAANPADEVDAVDALERGDEAREPRRVTRSDQIAMAAAGAAFGERTARRTDAW